VTAAECGFAAAVRMVDRFMETPRLWGLRTEPAIATGLAIEMFM